MNDARSSKYHIMKYIKYIKSVLWRVAKRLSYIEDARFLKGYISIEIKTNYSCVLHQLGVF